MGKAAEEAKGRRENRRAGGKRTGRCESLSPGDTIHLDGPGRVILKSTGANGGKVKVVWTGAGKVVKQHKGRK